MKNLLLITALFLSACSHTAADHARWDSECLANPQSTDAWCDPETHADFEMFEIEGE